MQRARRLNILWMAMALMAFHPALAASGADIAAHDAPPCASCHGDHGQGNAAAGFPRLAGLNAAYLQAQLHAFAEGRRQNPVMMPIARALTSAQITAVAGYYAGLAPSAQPAISGGPASSARGAVIAQRGIWQRAVPGCEQCHGPNGMGVGAAFPALAGQPASYIASQLRAWTQDRRPAGPLGLMPGVARRLSSADIDAVSAYFAALDPGKVVAGASR